jgi:DNA recombination protein RmuC
VLELGLAVGGVALGSAVTWLIARARLAALATQRDELRQQLDRRDAEVAQLRSTLLEEHRRRGQADERASAERRNLAEQTGLLEQARTRLVDTFKALSADALRDNRTAFLELAGEKLAGHLAPLGQVLGDYDAAVKALEQARQQAYGGLKQQVEALTMTSAGLKEATDSLVTALRAPQVRGRWGEITLRRVVELAGMVEYCDFVEQVTVEAEGGRLRPDMVVRLPSGREIVVDAKVPLTAYLDALVASADEERGKCLARHAQQVRQHMNALAAKAYWEEFGKAAEFVVMFIPGESFVAAAAHADHALIEDGMAKGVIVATPTTLIALLRAIAYGWRQEQVAENAQQIRELGQELYERVRVMVGYLDEVGDKLGKATAVYNKAVGSLESRVLPAARRFRDLGAGAGAEIATLHGVDEQPRAIDAPELPRQLEAPGIAE